MNKQKKKKYLVTFLDGRESKVVWMVPVIARDMNQRGNRMKRFHVYRA